MELTELYDGIHLQKEMREKLEDCAKKFDMAKVEEQIEKLMDIRAAQPAYEVLLKSLGEDEEHVKLLLCNLECARRIYDKYREKGIPGQIFFDTMMCFTRFIGECQKKTGKTVFDRGFWTYRQVSMNLFRIGELEYELTEEEGEKVISVHIPSDAKLLDDKIDASLEAAKEFMKQFFPEYAACKYVCESWLLSLKLNELLSENSNIIKFQKRFEVVKMFWDDDGYIEWLFQAPEDTPHDKLREDTSLQRKVKEILQKGEKIGAGYGYIRGE